MEHEQVFFEVPRYSMEPSSCFCEKLGIYARFKSIAVRQGIHYRQKLPVADELAVSLDDGWRLRLPSTFARIRDQDKGRQPI